MANERLRRALHEAGVQLDDLAHHVGVDAKTAERWITKDRLPHPRNRAQAAQLVGVDELVLWPQVADGRRGLATSEAEVVGIYPTRGAVPGNCWYDLIEAACQHVDVLVYSGLFLADGRADLPALLCRKAEENVRVRLLYGDPCCEAVALRGEDEGIGDGLAARIRISMAYMRPAFGGVPGVEARSHATTLYNSMFRFDDDLMVNMHAYGAGAPRSPVLHLRRIACGPLFDYYMGSFERVWESGVAMSMECTEKAMVV